MEQNYRFKNEQKKKTYLLDNSKYIFPYFEKKKELSQGKQKNKNTILHNFFKKDKNVKIKMEETESDKFLININENLLNIKNYPQLITLLIIHILIIHQQKED